MKNQQAQISLLTALTLLFFGLIFWGLAIGQESQEDLPKGIGPIESIELTNIDPSLAEAGKATFEQYCTACHKFEERYVGPALYGVTERRAPEWIMNMILNTNEMVMNDDTAYNLLAEFMTQMPQLGLSEDQARGVLEYFRSQDAAQ